MFILLNYVSDSCECLYLNVQSSAFAALCIYVL